MKIVVYIRAADERSLRSEGVDPAKWVRDLVRLMLERRKESNER